MFPGVDGIVRAMRERTLWDDSEDGAQQDPNVPLSRCVEGQRPDAMPGSQGAAERVRRRE